MTAPSTDYVQQSAADLSYYLLEGAAPTEVVRVLEERRLLVAGGAVTLAIIGSSHFLEVRSNSTTFCEMLACPRPGLKVNPLLSPGTGEERQVHQLRRGSLCYQFEGWRDHLSLAAFEKETERLSTTGAGRLFYVFPRGREEMSALTSLEWQVDGSRIDVVTHHTFPAELTIVRTRSGINLPGSGAEQ